MVEPGTRHKHDSRYRLRRDGSIADGVFIFIGLTLTSTASATTIRRAWTHMFRPDERAEAGRILRELLTDGPEEGECDYDTTNR